MLAAVFATVLSAAWCSTWCLLHNVVLDGRSDQPGRVAHRVAPLAAVLAVVLVLLISPRCSPYCPRRVLVLAAVLAVVIATVRGGARRGARREVLAVVLAVWCSCSPPCPPPCSPRCLSWCSAWCLTKRSSRARAAGCRARSPAAGSFGGAPPARSPSTRPVPDPARTGLTRRLRRRHRCLARDDATIPALNGLAAGAAFGLWCAGGGANTACASTGCVEMEVRLQVYGSGTRNKSSGLIRGFSRAKRHATVDAVERNARRCSFFEHLQPARWVVTQARDRQPSLFPPPLHTVPTASTCMAVCSPPNAPPRGAPKRAQGIWIAQMVLFPGRRRHVGGAKRRR